ncbi:MAG TPA: bifunctional phosphopantothenoylcysteine decarboxylase/phosphopantothenate--cysteine ligase CoaBC [Leucothrix mucor]|nr:bifunctional phosphopantothenoylcysteine decarboxylase/phosphopantothenate--cysteine ligase CoaBC [Leucothrix mucor]
MTNHINKNIVVGISGGIAAYKTAELVRGFVKAGINVRVCMTDAATQFITPLTFQALSANPVHTDLLDTDAEAGMGHIELARWADMILIAPASADLMARLSIGMANDLLSTVCLATTSPIHLAPAMNHVMWDNPATQHNLQTLVKRGMTIHGPNTGEQACGEVGAGRMLEPHDIINQCLSNLTLTDEPKPLSLKGKHILLTAGPTREAIDPVRYISNRSSGKMGYSIAIAARKLGAMVTIVSGPVALDPPQGIDIIRVESAAEMHSATLQAARNADIFIATAAVSDFSTQEIFTKKIKKSGEHLHLQLKQNADILADVSHLFDDLFSVGFAAETHNLMEYAHSKLQRKKLDLIVANPVGEGKGFDQETNQLEIIWSDGHISLPEKDKQTLAYELMDIIVERYNLR